MAEIGLPLALLLVGAAAFFLEAFIPSGGLISVVATACVVGAVVVAFVNVSPTAGLAFLGVAIVLVPSCLVVAFTLLPRTALGQRLMLKTSQKADAGYVAQSREEEELVGQEGVALSTLRPAGEARIGDRRMDVMTEGALIEKGTKIVVRRVEGNRIVVRRIKSDVEET